MTRRDAFDAYLSRLGSCTVFGPGEEKVRGQALVDARAARFAELFRYPPLVFTVADCVRTELELDPSTTAALEQVLDRARTCARARNLEAERDLHQAAVDLGRRLAPLDLETQLAARLMADLERMNRGEAMHHLIVKRRPGAHGPFRAHLERCRVTNEALAREVDAFTRANLRLVVRISRTYDSGVVPFGDLVQEGNLGLMKAVERFDPTRGFRFSTYASWWIRHGVTRAIYNKGRAIRLPVHVHEARHKITRARRRMELATGRTPTIEALASVTGLPESKIRRVTALENAPIASLDVLVDADLTLGETLESDLEQPESALARGELENTVELALAELRPIEADILRSRYGFDGDKQTLQQIGDRHALSRERVRQLQEGALARVRARLRALDLL